MNPFKVGDIVRPDPKRWYDPKNLVRRFRVVEVDESSVFVQWEPNRRPDEFHHEEFILAEDSIIDKLLEKYS